MKFRKINVHPLRGADPRLRAVANILTTDGYAINGIRVYEDKGKMYVLDDNGIKCECIVTDEGNDVLEIKNIATVPDYQGKGYAKSLIDFIVEKYREQYAILQVGTGDSPLTIPFYEKCGFVRSHIISNFFTDNYDHPIYEDGVQLVDMVYLQRQL